MALTQRTFRFRTDAGAVDAASPTWGAAQGVNYNPPVETAFRLRFSFNNTITTAGGPYILRLSKNSGAYAAITTSSTNGVQSADASSDADGAAIATANFRLGAGTGTALAGVYDENGSATLSVAASRYTEIEYGLIIKTANCAHGDTLDFRLYNNTTAFGTYTATPRITVVKPAHDCLANDVLSASSVSNPAAVYVPLVSPTFDLDLTNSASASVLTAVRSTVSLAENLAGTWVSFAANVPRITDKGLFIEEQHVNYIKNNSMQGAAIGIVGGFDEVPNPTGLPDFWGHDNRFMLPYIEVVGLGTTQGLDYIDIRFKTAVGGTTGDYNFFVSFDPATIAVGLNSYCCSIFLALVGGSLDNVTSIRPIAKIYDNPITSWLDTIDIPATGEALTTIDGKLRRYYADKVLTAPASALAHPGVYWSTPGGTSLDFTLRIASPQFEYTGAQTGGNSGRSYPTSPIRTTNVALGRGDEQVTVNDVGTWWTNTDAGTIITEVIIPYAIGYHHFHYTTEGGSGGASARSSGNHVGAVGSANVSGGVQQSQQLTRMALTWGADDTMSFAVNGVLIGASSNADVSPLAPTIVRLGEWSGYWDNGLDGYLKRFTYYPTKVPNELLQFFSRVPYGVGEGIKSRSSVTRPAVTEGAPTGGLATIVFRSVANVSYATLRTSTVVTKPSGLAVGDFMLWAMFTGMGSITPSDGPDPTFPAGWTQIASSGYPLYLFDGGFAADFRVAYKFADSSDVAASNFTATHATASSQGAIACWTGVSTSTPLDVTPTQNSANTGVEDSTALGLTTVTNGACIVIWGADWGDSTTNLSAPSGTTPTFTERLDVAPLLHMFDGTLATAGATGNKTFANNSSSVQPWGTYMVALRPATTAGGVDALLANDVKSDSSVTQPAVKALHGLLANDVKSNSSVSQPAAIVRRDVLANDVVSASSVSQPAVKALHGLLANDVLSASSVTTAKVAETNAAAPANHIIASIALAGPRNNHTGEVGGHLTISAADVTVNWIGIPVLSGSTGTRNVRIYQWNNAPLLRSVCFDLTGKTADTYAWVKIEPLTLVAAGDYAIALEVWNGDGNYWYDSSTTTFQSVIAGSGNIYSNAVGGGFAGFGASPYVGIDLGWDGGAPSGVTQLINSSKLINSGRLVSYEGLVG